MFALGETIRIAILLRPTPPCRCSAQALHDSGLSEEQNDNRTHWCTPVQGLPRSAQCLFLRLYQRRGPWFREDTLEYPEVGPPAPAIHQLQAAGLLQPAAVSDCAALIQVLFTIARRFVL